MFGVAVKNDTGDILSISNQLCDLSLFLWKGKHQTQTKINKGLETRLYRMQISALLIDGCETVGQPHSPSGSQFYCL